jgi:hypothetical protein
MYSALHSCPILIELEFSQHIFQNFPKSVQWKPSCSMQSDVQKDMTKLKVAFRNFAKAPVNIRWFHRSQIPHILIAFNGRQTRLHTIYILGKH